MMNYNIIRYKAAKWWLRSVIAICLLGVTSSRMAAQQTDSLRVFTETTPLIYEDAWDLWPYVFLDENGEATGYNVDLIKIIFKELRIPYVIKLKSTQEALEDLKSGNSDVMCGMDAPFHKEYADFGRSVIQIFTHSVIHQKGEEPQVNNTTDLAQRHVMVHNGSFSHHLMMSNGWGGNAIPYDDMEEALQRAHTEPGIQIVWNTMSLKYLLQTHPYDNLTISPVKIPHGEYKFMSNNHQLLQQIDSVYQRLDAEGILKVIQNKWFYPERKDSGIPAWIWHAVIIMVILSFIALVYYIFYKHREKKMTKHIRRSNNRLSLVLKTSHIHIWLFNVDTKNITPLDQNGNLTADEQAPPFFFQHLTVADRDRAIRALQLMHAGKRERMTLDVQSAVESEDEVPRYYTISLSVLRRDRDGHPTDIIGTTSDVTDDRLLQYQVKDFMLRYQTIFNSYMVDTVTYDKDGYIIDMNDKASQLFLGGKEGAIRNRVNLRDVLNDPDFDLEHMETTSLTLYYRDEKDKQVFTPRKHGDLLHYELKLVPLRDEEGRLLMIFGTGRDVTDLVHSYSRLQKDIELLQHANEDMESYIRNIDFVLENGGVRLVKYSPDTHMLAVFSHIGQEQNQLTQTRALSLVDDESKKTAQRILTSMDNRSRSFLKAAVRTTLRGRGGKRLCLYLSLIPTFDDEGKLVSYFGMCRDISDIKATEAELARETVRAQEVETVKNAFLRNMSYEIRTPLNSVVGFAELFSMEHAAEDEAFFIKEIKDNSAHLLKLINDILFLSRLDAHMIEMKKEPIDFAGFFEPRCQAAWYNHRQENVGFVVENPYLRLVLDIDEQNLGIIIDQIVANAAEHTTSGQIHIFYDYTGEELVMAFQDTGCGIPEERMKQIFERFGSMGGNGTGLGLPICHDLAEQMGGRIRIKSTPGVGTIVWVDIPCTCREIVRK